jgi:hydrogenase-4 component F
MVNHAMVKSLMFFTSGNLILKFHTKDMEHIKGVLQIMPVSGVVLLVAGLALAGSPPFSIFISEFYVLSGGIEGNHWIASTLFLLFLLIAFGGLSYHFLQMTIGPTTESNITLTKSEINKSSIISLIVPLILVCILGIWIPGPLLKLLNEATKIVTAGHTI